MSNRSMVDSLSGSMASSQGGNGADRCAPTPKFRRERQTVVLIMATELSASVVNEVDALLSLYDLIMHKGTQVPSVSHISQCIHFAIS